MDGIDATGTTTLTGNCEMDGRDGSIECDGLVIRLNAPAVYENIGYEVLTPAGATCTGSDVAAPSIAVFSFGSLVIAQGANLYVRGPHAIAIVAAGSIEIHGTVTGFPGETGGFAGGTYDGLSMLVFGPAVGADCSGETSGGAGGGGGLTAGGGGGNGDGTPGGALLPAQVEPMCGGSGGGMVGDIFPGGGAVVYGMGGGAGGAAILFAADDAIVLDGTGDCGVRANGGMGSGSERGGPGGGAGGTLLFEAPTVTLSGSCSVSAAGGAGAPSLTAVGGLGGDGVATPESGGAGTYGGGGGGSAGFIRVRTTTCPSSFGGFFPTPTCEILPTS